MSTMRPRSCALRSVSRLMIPSLLSFIGMSAPAAYMDACITNCVSSAAADSCKGNRMIGVINPVRQPS